MSHVVGRRAARCRAACFCQQTGIDLQNFLSHIYYLKLGFNLLITCQVLVFGTKFTSNEVPRTQQCNFNSPSRDLNAIQQQPHIMSTLLQDLPNAMNAAEITDKLALHQLRQRNWYIQATCATSGDGLYEGLDWLSNQLKNQK